MSAFHINGGFPRLPSTNQTQGSSEVIGSRPNLGKVSLSALSQSPAPNKSRKSAMSYNESWTNPHTSVQFRPWSEEGSETQPQRSI